jgi:myo-inositol-1-phosphate synthase
MTTATDFDDVSLKLIEAAQSDLAKISSRMKALQAEQRELQEKQEQLQSILGYLQACKQEGVTKKYTPKRQQKNFNIRGMVKELLSSMKEFTAKEMVEAVQQLQPEAKAQTVLATISNMKTRGLVEFLGQSHYKSLVYKEEGE